MTLSTTRQTPTEISGRLLAWYDENARSLPWRTPPRSADAGGPAEQPDAYRIWLSEIMLQQTTVAAVKAYFEAFTARWPTVEALAGASEQEVMAAWAGLGYYSRARNLHACARTVVAEHGGRFPRTAAALKALPGIGDYTSAAIAAIAFDEPVAVVDGNIERVTTRLYRIEAPLPKARPAIRTAVQAITPTLRPGDFAQAMMDLGATICTPKRPRCLLCPLQADCEAVRHGDQERYPVKAAKKPVPERVGAAFVARRPADGAVWLRRRSEPGMLSGMSEAPSTAWSAKADGATGADAAPFAGDWHLAGAVEHGFTHFRLTLDVFTAEIDETPGPDGWWAPVETIAAQGLPTLMRKVVTRALAGGSEAPLKMKRPGVRDRAALFGGGFADNPAADVSDADEAGTARRSRPLRRSRRTSAKWSSKAVR